MAILYCKRKGVQRQMRKPFFIKYRKEFVLYRIRKKLLAITAVLLVVFAMFAILLFHFSERKAYQKSVAELNEVMVNQVAAVYELYIQNTKEIAHDAIFSNRELLGASAKERENLQTQKEILNMLDSINVMNPYIYSACLFYEEDDMVYSSVSMPYSIMSLSNFGDKMVFEERSPTRSYQVGPHLLNSTDVISDPREKPLVISYVVPRNSGNGAVYLCVNVNTRMLYSRVLRTFELEQNKNFYLVDTEGYVVFHRNPEYLFIRQEELPVEEGIISSEVHSDILDIIFVFESAMPPLESGFLRFSLWILAALGVAVTAMIVTVVYSTLPIRKMAQIAKKSNLRDFLVQSGDTFDTTFWDRTIGEEEKYVVSVFQIGVSADTEEFLSQCIKVAAQNEKECHFFAIKMSSDTVAIIFSNIGNYGDTQFRRYVQLQCENMIAQFKSGSKIYCVISKVKEGVEQLRDGYQECHGTFRYRYLFPYQVIAWEEINRELPVYPFPVRHERHIINNMMAGNKEACIRHIDAIFEEFRSGEYLIKDREINRYLAVMQENIVLRLENGSIPVERLAGGSFEACTTLEELYTVFVGYVYGLFAQIANRPVEGEDNINNVVLDYIEKHYWENDICLSKIAEELSIASSQISRIVKEASHRSFSEYITFKRIERSKELLADGSMSINAVSEAVGFTYPYYFIRKFKEQEGVTPGQYIGKQSSPDQML